MVFHSDAAWITWLWVGSAALFFALSFVWPSRSEIWNNQLIAPIGKILLVERK